MMRKNAHVLILALVSALLWARVGVAIEAKSPTFLEPGEVELTAAAGPVVLPDEKIIGLELSFRIGIAPAVELAAPLGIAFRLIEQEDAGTLYFALGIADLYFPGYNNFVYRPTAMLAGAFYIGRESTLRGAIDFSGAEEGFSRGDHPAWLRGSAAAIIDFGDIATLGIGIAYQRVVIEGTHPKHLDRTGWAYDARISFGSVQTQPFSELPFFSIHFRESADFIIISKIDVNTDTGEHSFRLLAGFTLFR